MELLKAIILGIIQGLTEFLPVSSSGHLELAQSILRLEEDAISSSLMMTVILHFATALSTLVVFRKEVAEILKGLLQFKNNEETAFSFKIVLSMIPAAAVGFLFEEEIDGFFQGQILLVGSMLLITGILLFLADRAKKTDRTVSYPNAFIIGVAQAIAILPGISRSGATIATSVLLGVDRTRAARFSFLMVVPLIFGKMAKDVLSGDLAVSSSEALPLILGFVAAFVTGWLACSWMIHLVRQSKLVYFAIYCFLVGTVAIISNFL